MTSTTRIALLLLIAAAAISAVSAADRGFNCEKAWGNKNSSDISTCFTSAAITTYISLPARAVGFAFGIIAIIISVIIILVYPVVMLLRYFCGCCGGHKRRPEASCCCGGKEWDEKEEAEKAAAYTTFEIRLTKLFSLILLVVGVGALVLTIVGGAQISVTFNNMFDEATGMVAWADTQIAAMKVGMTVKRRSTNQFELVPPLTEQFFIDTYKTTGGFRSDIKSYKDLAGRYANAATIVGIIIAILPMACLVITVLCAIFNVRTCILLVNSILHYVFLMPYGIIGGILLIMHVLLTDFCAERTAFLDNKPGLIKNYAVPLCETAAPFKVVERDVSTAIVSNSISACNQALTVCRNSTVFNASTPDVIYACDISNSTKDCPSLNVMSTRIGNMRITAGSGVFCTGLPITACDVFQCADLCNRQSVKDSAAKTADNVDFASAAGQSMETNVKPLLDCNRVMTELFSRVKSCDPFAISLVNLGAGLVYFQFLFVVSIFLICRGQKRFFAKEPAATEASSEPTADDTAKPAPDAASEPVKV